MRRIDLGTLIAAIVPLLLVLHPRIDDNPWHIVNMSRTIYVVGMALKSGGMRPIDTYAKLDVSLCLEPGYHA